MSNSLWPHGLQHARLPCLSLSPGFVLNLCPLSQWCYPTISSSAAPLLLLPSISSSGSFPVSQLCIRWSKYECFSISPSSEYPGLISFRTDWLNLHAVQGTLKLLLQNYNLRASVLQHPAFLMVQPSHLYMTTGKTTAVTRQIFDSEGCENGYPWSQPCPRFMYL